MKKVALGLSGGVDSAVAAALLIKQGYAVTAVHLVCYREPGCRADADRKDALRVALKLGLPFKILDFRQAYKKKVLEYFWSEIKKDRTPNPDIVCNQEIKFGLFYQWAIKHGFNYIATGHYAKISQWPIGNNQWLKTLAIPKDKHKDQTYFLYRLTAKQLKHLIFPLGDLTKVKVRQLAKEHHLPVAGKKDSTGICFIGELNVRQFIKDKLGENPGPVVNTKGEVIGEHQGRWFYTLGQSGGWRIWPQKQTAAMTKLYVVGKDKKHNRLVVGTRKEAMKQEFMVEDLSWLVPPKAKSPDVSIEDPRQSRDSKLKAQVRIRHRGELLRGKLQVASDKRVRIKLEKPAFGVATGQSAVFYLSRRIPKLLSGEGGPSLIVLGGGIISS